MCEFCFLSYNFGGWFCGLRSGKFRFYDFKWKDWFGIWVVGWQ